MLESLNPRHGTEVWLNAALSDRIGEAVAEALGTEPGSVRWYLWAYPEGRQGRRVWYGTGRALDFLRFALHRSARGQHPALYATASATAGGLARDEDAPGTSLWLGDVSGSDLVCGDELLVALWYRLRDGTASGASTRRA